MKPETTTWQVMIRVWGILFSIMAASFLAKEHNMVELSTYMTLINIITYFGTGIYGLVSFMIAIRNRLCPLCTLMPMFAHVVMITMGIMDIIWVMKSDEQQLITWLNLAWACLELSFCVFTMLSLYIINNFEMIYKKNIQNNPNLRQRRETDSAIETRR